MVQSNKIRILVVEDEPDLREIIAFFIESNFGAEVVEAENGLLAKQILESDSNFQIIASDYSMPHMNGGELFQYIKGKNLPMKFILVSALNPETVPEFKTVKPDAFAEKPGFSAVLKSSIHQFLSEMNVQDVVPDYVRISIHQLHHLGKMQYPIFAKLSEGKFVKVVNQGEEFGVEELVRFESKKIHHLYVERIHAMQFFNGLRDLYLARMNSDTITSTEMIKVGDQISASIQNMASEFGFSEELEEMTKAGVDLALKALSKDPSLKNLLENISDGKGEYLAIHCSRLPYIANHIVKLMGWDSDSTAYKMALASMLHDSTLANSALATYQNESDLDRAGVNLSKEDLENFLYHPASAAEIAKKFKGIPADVDTIILQHHEKCDGTGFPNRLNHSKISPLSCAFIVSHDLLCEYEKNSESFLMEKFIENKKEAYSMGHFKKILNELSKLKIEN